jgi:predicted RNA-binding protein YlqC (UPF0109 family)
MIEKLLEYMVKNLVEHTDAVSIATTKRGEHDILEITVNDADRGKVIGREGQTIKTLRSLINAVAPAGTKINIDVAQQR